MIFQTVVSEFSHLSWSLSAILHPPSNLFSLKSFLSPLVEQFVFLLSHLYDQSLIILKSKIHSQILFIIFLGTNTSIHVVDSSFVLILCTSQNNFHYSTYDSALHDFSLTCFSLGCNWSDGDYDALFVSGSVVRNA